jgi:hypothetical protein
MYGCTNCDEALRYVNKDGSSDHFKDQYSSGPK